MSGLIWIQSVLYLDGIPENNFLKKVEFEKKEHDKFPKGPRVKAVQMQETHGRKFKISKILNFRNSNSKLAVCLLNIN